MSNTVNADNPNIDQTVKIFDRFYKYEANIPVMEYDAINSYLSSVFGTKQQADNFTATFFRIVDSSQIPAMDLLQQIQGQSAPQVTLTFAYYLNSFQSASTLLGINTPTQPNYYTAHNIRQ
jgi:hypothetical protein